MGPDEAKRQQKIFRRNMSQWKKSFSPQCALFSKHMYGESCDSSIYLPLIHYSLMPYDIPKCMMNYIDNGVCDMLSDRHMVSPHCMHLAFLPPQNASIPRRLHHINICLSNLYQPMVLEFTFHVRVSSDSTVRVVKTFYFKKIVSHNYEWYVLPIDVPNVVSCDVVCPISHSSDRWGAIYMIRFVKDPESAAITRKERIHQGKLRKENLIKSMFTGHGDPHFHVGHSIDELLSSTLKLNPKLISGAFIREDKRLTHLPRNILIGDSAVDRVIFYSMDIVFPPSPLPHCVSYLMLFVDARSSRPRYLDIDFTIYGGEVIKKYYMLWDRAFEGRSWRVLPVFLDDVIECHISCVSSQGGNPYCIVYNLMFTHNTEREHRAIVWREQHLREKHSLEAIERNYDRIWSGE
ncbi:hypothetical protein ADUPG1_014154 [Aduncisulcus paluster]|uniref:Uncharacterized protein n=1 Tax=Aduncisulcus paluster TaxID=2918883 RepID=A0ABQ5KEA4_9EUKA|nr:hypothetical protein ADUPG1_014154 [Aduncisulcus paluster]